MADENNSDADPVAGFIGFQGVERPRFAEETAALLRRRLLAVALILFAILAVAFIRNLFLGSVPLLALRAVVLSVFVASMVILRSRIQLTPLHLHLIELANFGALSIHLLLLMDRRITIFALAGDGTSAVAVQHLFLSSWSIMLLTYGIFMPNTWKRSMLVLMPLACLPYLTLAFLRWRVPDVAVELASSNMVSSVPLPIVAAVVAVFGTHIINSVRREEFRARQLGQYRLKQQLGVGRMGIVYEAEHQLLKRPCAIKLIRPENEADAKAIARFEQEVCSTAQLSHWNTVEIFDYGHTEDGTFFYVMELLPGLSLEELVKQHGPMVAERTVHFLRQTCRALNEAHAMGLIHRDIKPANIVAAQRGGIYDVAKLLDFGLVRHAVAEAPASSVGQVAQGFSGSPAYIAPEQSEDYDNTDARGDIYALGAVGYFLLTGRPPFSGKNAFEILLAHRTRAVTPPSQVQATVPQDLENVLLRCLEKDPDRRFQSARDLETALATCDCAGGWTDELAAAWWSTHEPDQGQDPVAAAVGTGIAADS